MIERRGEVRQESLDMIYSFIRRAIKERATDVHWEPYVESGKPEMVIRFRIDGMLKDMERFSEDKTRLGSVVNAIKIMASMDPTQKRFEQDGRFTVSIDNVDYDIRISAMPTILGEKIVMRLMDRKRYCMSLADLGMSKEVLDIVNPIIYKPEGFVIISGPTGSGKTTSLYSILQHIYSRDKNICTIEDPVEVKFVGINQIQVDHDFGMTFVKGLRAIMRQDPNVIAVGEMRDAETVRTALQAALVGAMVFSTVHAKDAINTIVRLLDMGVEPFFISTALTGIVSQRLLRLVCKICKGKGCMQCANTGFRRRTGLFEVLKINDIIRQLILRRASADELRAAAAEQGMLSFATSVEPLIAQGVTTREEIDRILAVE
jgi:type II secretory ATPase GspE/PulE/Tfp pilus assembly ATPase PilB-like protein